MCIKFELFRGDFVFRPSLRLIQHMKREDQTLRCLVPEGKSSYLVLCHSANNQWAHHPGQSTHTIRNAHQDTGIAWSDVQVIDIKA